MRVWALAIGCWLLVLGYFGWWGMTNPVWEGDSLAYHIPIAKMIESGKWTDIDSFKLPFYYYPAMGETLLAGWVGLGLPGNWFNLLGWGMFTAVVYGLGRRLGLNKENSTMAAVAAAFWPSVIRLIPTQTVDIWVAIWWTAAVIQILKIRDQKLKSQIRSLEIIKYIWLGLYLGMLAGTKYSGLIFAGILMVFFYKELKKHFWHWLIPAVLIGGFWYVRNWMVTGNPVYPLEVSWLGWMGEPDLAYFGGNTLTTLLNQPGLVLQALMSEYLIWAGLLAAVFWTRSKWVWLGILNFGVYLLLPSMPQNIVSDLRYTYPAFIPLLISVWKKTEETGRGELIRLAVMVTVAAGMTQLDYHPKLFVIMIFGIVGIFNVQFSIFNKKTN